MIRRAGHQISHDWRVRLARTTGALMPESGRVRSIPHQPGQRDRGSSVRSSGVSAMDPWLRLSHHAVRPHSGCEAGGSRRWRSDMRTGRHDGPAVLCALARRRSPARRGVEPSPRATGCGARATHRPATGRPLPTRWCAARRPWTARRVAGPKIDGQGNQQGDQEPANFHQSMERLRDRVVPLGRTCFEECHGARSCRKGGRDQRLRSLYSR